MGWRSLSCLRTCKSLGLSSKYAWLNRHTSHQNVILKRPKLNLKMYMEIYVVLATTHGRSLDKSLSEGKVQRFLMLKLLWQTSPLPDHVQLGKNSELQVKVCSGMRRIRELHSERAYSHPRSHPPVDWLSKVIWHLLLVLNTHTTWFNPIEQ